MKSLRGRISILVFTVIIMLCMLLICSNGYAIQVVRNNAYEDNVEIMTISLDHADSSMKLMENYWAGIQASSDLYQLMGKKTDIHYYTAKARLKLDMENIVQTYEYVEGIFVFVKEKQDLFTATKYSVEEQEQRTVREKLLKEIGEQKNAEEETEGKWQWIENNGAYYLIRIFQVMDVYMGGWVSMEHITDTLKKSGMKQAEYLTFADENGVELGHVLERAENLNTDLKNHSRQTIKKDKRNYLLVACPSQLGQYYLVELIKDTSILEGLENLQRMLVVLLLLAAIFMLFFRSICNQWILQPVQTICSGLKSLRDGNLNSTLPDTENCAEFRMVNEAFNDMARNIRTLKIGVYEEKMMRQQSELQYMKLQINPHFYINCLNVIHNLSIMKKNELICEMTGYLGNHLRYTMEGNTLDLLKKEIAYVKNYIHIQEVRFGKSLRAFIEAEEGTEQVLVPPLIIQTFLENTVKYQVVAGSLTEIYIVICWAETREDHRIRIEIWDNGNGFPDEILEKLQSGERVLDERGEHFGIRNVCTRLNLIYKGKEKIRLANHEETGGAWIVIEIPDQKGESEEEL